MATMRLEVQQVAGGDTVAFEANSHWSRDAANLLIEVADTAIGHCEGLGISLYQFAAQASSEAAVRFQERSNPPGMRQLTMRVNLGPAAPAAAS